MLKSIRLGTKKTMRKSCPAIIFLRKAGGDEHLDRRLLEAGDLAQRLLYLADQTLLRTKCPNNAQSKEVGGYEKDMG